MSSLAVQYMFSVKNRKFRWENFRVYLKTNKRDSGTFNERTNNNNVLVR